MSDFVEHNRQFSSSPETATQVMLEVFGHQAFALICDALGGAEIKAPKVESLTDDHVLVERLGWEAATKFCETFAGDMIYIPKSAFRNEIRNEYITEAIMAGVPRNEIALNLNLSASYLRRLVSKLGLSGVVAADTAKCEPPALPYPVSNGGLTGLPPISAPIPHPATETRVSEP